MQALSCGLWDCFLTKDGARSPLHWEHGVLATGPPRKFSNQLSYCFGITREKIFSLDKESFSSQLLSTMELTVE